MTHSAQIVNIYTEVEGDVANDTVIWKFLSFPKFVSVLSKGLWFARIDTLDDQHEGYSSAQYRKSISDNPLDPALENLIRSQNREFFVNCWHRYEYELDFMWKLYGIQEGIAIESTYGKLRSSLETFHGYQEIAIGPIKYYDDIHEEIWAETDYEACLRKRKAYEPEQEIRAIVNPRKAWRHAEVAPVGEHSSKESCHWYQDCEGNRYTDDKFREWVCNHKGFYAPINFTALIDHIVLPPDKRKIPWIEDAIRYICDRCGIPADKIINSRLNEPPPVTKV